MGQLNIKDEVLIEKVRRLAERRRTTQTEVLRQVVEEALQRDEAAREADITRKLAAIEEIVKRTAPLFDKAWDGDHSYLYGEDGLPK